MSELDPRYARLTLSREERLLLLSRFDLRPDVREKLDPESADMQELWLTVRDADDLREAAQDLLQTEGFDDNYFPTRLGRQLELLIDKLYTG